MARPPGNRAGRGFALRPNRPAPLLTRNQPRLYPGSVVGAIVNGGAEAHTALAQAAPFTLDRPIICTGCVIYTTPFDVGIASNTKMGIVSDPTGVTPAALNYLADGRTPKDPGIGKFPVVVYFYAPVYLAPGTIYAVTANADGLVSTGTTFTGAVTGRQYQQSSGGGAYADGTAGYKMPMQLYGYEVSPLNRDNISARTRIIARQRSSVM